MATGTILINHQDCQGSVFVPRGSPDVAFLAAPPGSRSSWPLRWPCSPIHSDVLSPGAELIQTPVITCDEMYDTTYNEHFHDMFPSCFHIVFIILFILLWFMILYDIFFTFQGDLPYSNLLSPKLPRLEVLRGCFNPKESKRIGLGHVHEMSFQTMSTIFHSKVV